MARINLLPWREERRKQQQIEFFVVLGLAVVVTLGLWGGVHWHFDQRINYQETRNQYLDGQIARLDLRIKEIQELERERERLLARMRAIEQLQTNRPLIVRLFDELVDNLPEGVSLTRVQQQGDNITINGVAQSNARVSNFMRNLEDSPWLSNPDLDIVQAQTAEGLRVSNFTLRFSQIIPKAEEDKGA